jgi:monoamine oxidase
MFDLCREFGLEVYPQYEQGDNVAHLDGKNRRYRKYPNVGPFALVSLGLAFWRLDRMLKRLPRDGSWGGRRGEGA